MSNYNTITYYVDNEEKEINFDRCWSELDDLVKDINGYYKDQDGNVIRYKDDLIK